MNPCHYFQNIPFHQQTIVLCILGCTMLCVFCFLWGLLTRCRNPYALPPHHSFYPGSGFPRWWAQLIAVVYLLMYFWFAMDNALTTPGETAGLPQDSLQKMVNAIAAVIIQNALSLPLVIILILQPKPDPMRHRFLFGLAAISIGMMFVFQCTAVYKLLGVADWLQTLTQCPANQEVVDSFGNSALFYRILLGISACILAPIVEECYFRGFLYTTLRYWAGPVAAAICSSMFFGCVHGAVVQFFPLTLVGMVLCLLYERFRSLWVPICFHAVFNLTNLLLVLLYEYVSQLSW